MVNSGPGLVFITYPEVVLKLPGGPIWAVTFFLMLVVRNLNYIIRLISIRSIKLKNGYQCAYQYLILQTIGIDSEFCIVESLVTGIVDMWPDYLRPRRRKFTAGKIV